MQQVKPDEASRQLATLFDAAIRGEVVLITTENQETVQLVVVRQAKPSRRFGSAEELITTTDNFDAPLDDLRGLAVVQ